MTMMMTRCGVMRTLMSLPLLLMMMLMMAGVARGGMMMGNQPVTTHHYHVQRSALSSNPVACGVYGHHIDLTRITAVQGLTPEECGTCLRVTNANDDTKFAYVMALDNGGRGLDLNADTFRFLFAGQDTGVFPAKWDIADSKNCVGIVTGGNYKLPGHRI